MRLTLMLAVLAAGTAAYESVDCAGNRCLHLRSGLGDGHPHRQANEDRAALGGASGGGAAMSVTLHQTGIHP